MRARLLVLILAANFLAVCAFSQQAPQTSKPPAAGTQNAGPCEDFFEYANAEWLKGAKIPAEYPSWDSSMEIYERNMSLLKGIMEEAAGDASSPKGSIRRLVGDFYASGMDEATIEKAGASPLSSRFDSIAKVNTPKELAVQIAKLHLEGIDAAFDFEVNADDKASETTIVKLSQSGLGLPDRDYYTKDDGDSKALRAKYVQHVGKMFELLGDRPDAALREAEDVMALETRLANSSMTAVERRDPNAIYHKTTRGQLEKDAPGFDWAAYFEAMGVPAAQEAIVVRQPEFFKNFALMAQDVPVEKWRTYLRWNLLHHTAHCLSSAFMNETFSFYFKTLNGVEEISPRWKRVLRATEAAMGEAVGQLYVEKAFSPEAKARVQDLVKNLQAALRDRILALDWMSPATKQKALKKLDVFIVKIGYPDKWRDYSGMEVSRGPFVLNSLAANLFETRRNIAKLGKPYDRSEWLMNAEEVNAYYEPLTNEVCFPAGVLQPPFFDPKADDATNYGATGATIGHEMTHGFDDEGSQYDEKGNLNDWWTEADRKAFTQRQEAMVKQYDAFRPFPDQAINGRLTLGENIADLGGLKIALAAYLKSQEGKSKTMSKDGNTPEQLFFLGYARSWRTIQRPESLRVQLNTDPHSPPKYRVNGPLADMPEFARAFGCAAGTPMALHEKDRPAIW